MKNPLISCIMATRDRADFVPRAIRCFQEQTYPNLELVIVDHGTVPVNEIVKSFGDDRIRYEHIPDPEMLTGDVKNRTVANATGEFIAVWDDDDWHHPARLMVQFERMRRFQADACFLKRLIVAWPERNLYAYSPRWLWEGSLVSRKAGIQPYGSRRSGGDTVQKHATFTADQRVVELDMPDLYIYRIHGRNVWDDSHFEEYFYPGYPELPEAVLLHTKKVYSE